MFRALKIPKIIWDDQKELRHVSKSSTKKKGEMLNELLPAFLIKRRVQKQGKKTYGIG